MPPTAKMLGQGKTLVVTASADPAVRESRDYFRQLAANKAVFIGTRQLGEDEMERAAETRKKELQ